MHAQTKKIGDAYGVAAMRAIIRYMAHDQDTSDPGLLSLLDELEAQISSPAEQSSYDDIRSILKARDDKWDNLIAPVKDVLKSSGINDSRITSLRKQADQDFVQYKASRLPCLIALKTNLKHRDGTIPQECKIGVKQ